MDKAIGNWGISSRMSFVDAVRSGEEGVGPAEVFREVNAKG